MTMKIMLAACAVAGLTAASGAVAKSNSDEMTPPTQRAVHRNQVARNRNPATQVDVPQEQAAPVAKPDEVPEVFYHASGSDGSHYGE